MKRERKCQIERPQPGVLTYREGSTEYRFPIYEEDGEIVFVAWPTSQSIFLFFLRGGWTRVPRQFSDADRERITAQVVHHLRREGRRVRILIPPSREDRALEFHPELFECRARASEVLDDADFVCFSDYSSIDLLHDTYGLEICGIKDGSQVEPVAIAMQAGFPHWHYKCLCGPNCGRDPGWKFTLHMFPNRC